MIQSSKSRACKASRPSPTTGPVGTRSRRPGDRAAAGAWSQPQVGRNARQSPVNRSICSAIWLGSSMRPMAS